MIPVCLSGTKMFKRMCLGTLLLSKLQLLITIAIVTDEKTHTSSFVSS